MLVVIVIIGIITSMAVISVNVLGGDHQMEQESRRLQAKSTVERLVEEGDDIEQGTQQADVHEPVLVGAHLPEAVGSESAGAADRKRDGEAYGVSALVGAPASVPGPKPSHGIDDSMFRRCARCRNAA